MEKKASFTEQEILEEFNLSYRGIDSSFYPKIENGCNIMKHNFFLDLEDGYLNIASNRIHLYGDENYWAVVFEKSGYHNRQGNSHISLQYIGNCIDYPIMQYGENIYISNNLDIELISSEEYSRICNQEGEDFDDFELISPLIEEVHIRNYTVKMEHDIKKYENLGIKVRDYENPKNWIGYEDLLRYLIEVNPASVLATDEEVKTLLTKEIPKLMTIKDYHYISNYDKDMKKLPSEQELFNIIAKVLVTRDINLFEPTLIPNNHWSNWDSGFL